jgi:heme A synthase
MTGFRKLAIASTVATFLLVALGGLVRATKSGLGCGTDWPHCSGDIIPVFGHRAVVIEYSHRLAAFVVIVLLGSLAVTAYRRLRDHRNLVVASSIAFGLVLFQAVLGAVVVKLELEAASVVLHLATAMALAGVLVYITIASSPEPTGTSDRSTSRAASFAAGAVLMLLLVGSYVSGSDTGNAFGDWPLMNGKLVPDLGVEIYAIHFLHRALAAVVGMIVLVVALRIARRRDEMPGAARLAHTALGLFGVEVTIGAANVWTGLNAAFVTLHLLVGALIWGSLVGAAVMTRPRAELAQPVVARREALLEGSR